MATITPLAPVVCVGPVTYTGAGGRPKGHREPQGSGEAPGVADAHVFMPATAAAGVGRNEYYKSEEEYFHAVAAALGEEYKASPPQGFLVQIDDPFLPDIFFEPGLSDAAKKSAAPRSMFEATNFALIGIPAEKLRFHTCYGINEGPRPL